MGGGAEVKGGAKKAGERREESTREYLSIYLSIYPSMGVGEDVEYLEYREIHKQAGCRAVPYVAAGRRRRRRRRKRGGSKGRERGRRRWRWEIVRWKKNRRK